MERAQLVAKETADAFRRIAHQVSGVHDQIAVLRQRVNIGDVCQSALHMHSSAATLKGGFHDAEPVKYAAVVAGIHDAHALNVFWL